MVQHMPDSLMGNRMGVLPCGHDGFAHLQDLQHDGQAQFERLELTQEILHLLFLEAPFDPLGYCDGFDMAILVPGLGQIHHVLELIEDHLALVPYLCGSIDSTLGRDGPSFLHGFTDLLEHEREEGDALGDAVDVAFRIGDLSSDGIEEKREAETSTGYADDGGYDAVSRVALALTLRCIFSLRLPEGVTYPISAMFVGGKYLRYVS